MSKFVIVVYGRSSDINLKQDRIAKSFMYIDDWEEGKCENLNNEHKVEQDIFKFVESIQDKYHVGCRVEEIVSNFSLVGSVDLDEFSTELSVDVSVEETKDSKEIKESLEQYFNDNLNMLKHSTKIDEEFNMFGETFIIYEKKDRTTTFYKGYKKYEKEDGQSEIVKIAEHIDLDVLIWCMFNQYKEF